MKKTKKLKCYYKFMMNLIFETHKDEVKRISKIISNEMSSVAKE